MVTLQKNTNRVQVTVEWLGGCRSQHELIRPVLSYRQMAEHERLLTRIRQLREDGLSFGKIAVVLNAEGFHPSKETSRSHAVCNARKKTQPLAEGKLWKGWGEFSGR